MALIAPVGTVGADLTIESTSLTLDFETWSFLKITNIIVFVGNDTVALRFVMDSDFDGNVTAAEVQAFEASNKADMVLFENLTRDSAKASRIEGNFTVDGGVGPTTSTDDLTWTIVSTSLFPPPPPPGDQKTHTFAWPAEESLIDEDEMWEAEVSTFVVKAPNGWTFDTDGWSEDTKAFLNSDGTIIEMNTAQIKASYNDTIGTLNSFVIKKEGDGNGDDDDNGTPGFTMAIALAAALMVTLIRRKLTDP
jgi:hypothetical protein